jgi:demethylmenaquinone methyltransferase/2-methoxy-6-polyprenyl-1,4-benzoquinol methylase
VARTEPGASVVGVDSSPRMLAVGRDKLARAGLSERVELRPGRAEALPFDADSFDALCIAFGIRNVADRHQALVEMCRVGRPGARVAVLELSEPERGVLAPLARFHVHTLVPWLGALLSGAREYRYLQRSIATFPPPDRFVEMMGSAGLSVLGKSALTFGVCHLYLAEVPSVS